MSDVRATSSSGGSRRTLLIVGLLLLLGCLGATPWVWKKTKAVLPKYKESKGPFFKVRVRTLTPLAGPYGGVLVGVLAGVWLLQRSRSKGGPPDNAPLKKPVVETRLAPKPPVRSSQKRWHSCNILDANADINHLWHFTVGGGKFKLDREQSTPVSEPLPPLLASKSWASLWQPKLNVAWLPAESVFLRVVHLPQSTWPETLSMVELQLEKLSPIPVTQVVWSASRVPGPTGEGALQTLVIVLAERKAVEEFLSKL
jgi:hypothetical protein